MTSILQDPCAAGSGVNFNSVWDQDWGDWEIDGTPSAQSNELLSAVVMLVFTDRRAPEDIELPTDTDDRRGWFGDFIDVREDRGETEMGSLLWVYERSILTDDVIKGIEDTVNDSLVPLTDQGLVADYTVQVERGLEAGSVHLLITMYAKTRQKVFEARFTRVWSGVFPGLAV